MRRVAQFCGVAVAMLVGAGLVGPVTSFAQKTFERPTTETGPIEARLVGPSTVSATQAGLWSVAIEGRPDVTIPAPAFLRAGETYRFRWSGGEDETYRLVEVTNDGWVRGELVGARPRVERWLNPARAISIERAGR